jgi:hypothetical protein
VRELERELAHWRKQKTCTNTLPEVTKKGPPKVVLDCQGLGKDRRNVRAAEVSHGAAGVTRVKGPTESFGFLIRRVQDTGEVAHDNQPIGTPFLNSEVLNVNVTGARGRLVLIDHVAGGTIVNVKQGGARRKALELLKNIAEVLGGFGGVDGGNELGLSRAGCTDALKLGFVGNSATSETEDVTGNGATGFEVSGMSGIHKTHKCVQGVEGKDAEIIRKSRGWIERNSRKEGARARTPVNNAPVSSATKIFADTLEGQVMILGRGRGETREEGGRVANVGATDDISIGEFAEDLAKRIANLFLECSMSGGALGRTRREFNKTVSKIHRDRNSVMTVSFLVAW